MRRPGHPSASAPVLAFQGERLRPPTDLGEAEREVFADLVGNSRADHFQPCDLPLLTAYCRASVIERETSEAIRKAPLAATASLLKANEQAVRTLHMLAMRLRCSPQARQGHKSKRSDTDAASVSYYERMSILRGQT
jgi:phage terminase small subunit